MNSENCAKRFARQSGRARIKAVPVDRSIGRGSRMIIVTNLERGDLIYTIVASAVVFVFIVVIIFLR